MSIAVNPLRNPILTAILWSITASLTPGLSCHAQTPAQAPAQAPSATATQLSPELHRRVEVLIRSRLNVPPDYLIAIGPRSTSEVPGYDQIAVTFTAGDKSSRPNYFLLSTDGKTLAQFNKFDISADLRTSLSDSGRPARGGSEKAPVLIVGFDDLECPFCARMHAALFPALLERYKDQVRIVYRDFPLSQHPWARHAAVDANCLAAESPTAYWSLVDYVHAHAADLGGADKSVEKADAELDRLTTEEAKRSHLKEDTLAACIKKQDESAIDASVKLGESLDIQATPVLFINGEKLEGAYPVENVFRMIDEALIAAGQTPPPPAPKPIPAPAPPAPPTPTSKPGK